jgi:hypothetical protein
MAGVGGTWLWEVVATWQWALRGEGETDSDMINRCVRFERIYKPSGCRRSSRLFFLSFIITISIFSIFSIFISYNHSLPTLTQHLSFEFSKQTTQPTAKMKVSALALSLLPAANAFQLHWYLGVDCHGASLGRSTIVLNNNCGNFVPINAKSVVVVRDGDGADQRMISPE